MYKNRKNSRGPLKTEESNTTQRSNKNKNYEIEEVLPPRSRRNTFKSDKRATDRACYFTPEQQDFSQITEGKGTQYQSLLLQQYGFDPFIPDTINQLKELQKVLCTSISKVDDCSQYVIPDTALLQTVDASNWLNVEDTGDVDDIIDKCRDKSLVKDIRISDVPRIKVIAEKFSTFKKNNVELRKLDEKVVCVEYDVFEANSAEPMQQMRAYFSIKPGGCNKCGAILDVPSNVKQKFDINEEDLKKLNDKEIEIIDGKVAENKPYIADLIKVLKRKEAIYIKKNRSTLDLTALYEMAKSNKPTLDDNFSDTNLLSKAELDDIKNLILKKVTSSMYGINRKTIKPEKDTTDSNGPRNANAISQSIFAELLRIRSKHS